MAEKFHFSLVSPQRALVSEEVDSVVVPGTEGEFGVLAGHAPVIANLRTGLLIVRNDGADTRYFVRNGIAEVTRTSLNVLAEDALPAEEASGQEIEQRISEAEKIVAETKGVIEKAHAQAALDQLRTVQQTL